MSEYENIGQIAESISSAEQMCKFLQLLKSDVTSNDDWENTSVDKYLEAMSAMIEDMSASTSEKVFQDKLQLNQVSARAWKTFALILLYAGRYE